jgi:hypothetical protein
VAEAAGDAAPEQRLGQPRRAAERPLGDELHARAAGAVAASVQRPSTGIAPSTMWVLSARPGSNSVNSTTWSQVRGPTFVRSLTR